MRTRLDINTHKVLNMAYLHYIRNCNPIVHTWVNIYWI